VGGGRRAAATSERLDRPVRPPDDLVLGDVRDTEEQAARSHAGAAVAGGEAPYPSRASGGASVASPVRGSVGAQGLDAVRSVLAGGGGRPLPTSLAAPLGARYGADLGAVRVHTDQRAAASARSIGARAYTVGADLVFGRGAYAPSTPSGLDLLAHEVAHAVREPATPARGVVRRQETDDAASEAAAAAPSGPPQASLAVTTSGLSFHPRGAPVLQAGQPVRPQLMAMALQRILGPEYEPGVEDRVLAHEHIRGATDAAGESPWTGQWADPARRAEAGEEYGTVFIPAVPALGVLSILQEMGFRTQITDEQRQILRRGLLALLAYADIRNHADEIGESLYPWFSPGLFTMMASSFGGDLLDYESALEGIEGGLSYAREFGIGALGSLVRTINESADVLEAIRQDTALAASDLGAVPATWRAIWAVPEVEEGEGAGAVPEPTQIRSEVAASWFLAFCYTQSRLVERAKQPDAHGARAELLHRFRWIHEEHVRVVLEGEEELHDAPENTNAPPLPSRLAASPDLMPPLYEMPLETDRRFVMRLQFPDVYEAFSAYYAFVWERIPVDLQRAGGGLPGAPAAGAEPESAATAPPPITAPERSVDTDAATMALLRHQEGALPEEALGSASGFSDLELARRRFARAAEYAEEDLATVRRELGEFNQGAQDAASLNAAMRYLGTGFRFALDMATTPEAGRQSEQIVTLPAPGLYLIRCLAVPRVAPDQAVVRPASMAVAPVLARPAEELAAWAAHQSATAAQEQAALLPDLQEVLEGEELEAEARTIIERMMEDIRAGQEGVGAELVLRHGRLRRAAARGTLSAEARRELETLTELIRIQEARAGDAPNLTTARPLHATFVSDEGQTVPLRMEASVSAAAPYSAHVSDLTTINSGEGTGRPGDSRRAALEQALRTLLAGTHGYGRGVCSYEWDGTVHSVRIAASSGSILMEAIDNASLVLSVAAIAAAPFTGGASLYVLIPMGVVGAIPSAYRLASRAEAETLRVDMESAIDVVNIVGAVAGLGEMLVASRTASLTARGIRPALRLQRVGQAFMILDVTSQVGGVMLMGAGVIHQLAQLRGLSEGERAARTMMILGNVMLQAGIAVGGALAARGVADWEAQLRERGVEPPARRGGDADAPARLPEHPPGDPTPTTEAQPTLPRRQDTPPVERDIPDPSFAEVDRPRGTSDEGRRTMADSRRGRGPGPTPEGPVRPPREEPLHDLLRQVDEHLPPAPRQRAEGQRVREHYTVAERIPDSDQAYAMYQQALLDHPGTEVGIFRNRVDETYAVRVGDAASVNSPRGGAWDAVVHFHHGGESERFRMPAPQDWRDLMMRRDGAPTREFIEFDLPGGGRGRTEYGIDPSHPEPFYTVTYLPDGSRAEVRFRHDGEYRAYWGSLTVPAPAGSPLRQLLDAEVEAALRGMPESTGDRTMSGTSGSPGGPLQTADGQLTAAGIAFLRESGPARLRGMEDAQIRQEFGNHGDVLEPLVLREMQRLTADDVAAGRVLLLTAEALGQSHFTVRGAVTRIFEAMAARGIPHPTSRSLLDRAPMELVGLQIDGRGRPTRRQSPMSGFQRLNDLAVQLAGHPDPRVRRAFNDFYWGDLLQTGGRRRSGGEPTRSSFATGSVGDRRPDAVQVYLDRSAFEVIDVTQRVGGSAGDHFFKTLFYGLVLEQVTGLRLENAIDYRSLLRMWSDQ
jgi:hypothetical protein